jgi:putative endonuclease
MSTSCNAVLYIGVTSSIEKRLEEHKQKIIHGFTSRYNLKKLVHVEETSNVWEALEREKQLKRWSRKKKRWLVELENPLWKDLSAIDPNRSLDSTSFRSR